MTDRRKIGPYRKRLTGDKGLYEPTVELLYKMVRFDEATGCHLWTGVPNHKGYGRIGVNYKDYLVHRLSYELQVGSIPDGMVVCHKCDTPACINPAHFFLGTRSDNHADMVTKKRHQIGSQRYNAKLSEDDVHAILVMKGSNREVAEQFGVSHSLISRIRMGKCWRHVA
jgi:hypothetical protein